MFSSLVSDGPNLTAFSACFQQPQALCERKDCNFSIFLIKNLDDNFIFPLFQYMIFSYSRCDNMKKAHTQKTICVRALVTRCHLNYKGTIPLYISACLTTSCTVRCAHRTFIVSNSFLKSAHFHYFQPPVHNHHRLPED